MHNKGFVNRDIKIDNMFVDANFQIKIGDFGFGSLLEGASQTGMLTSTLGTPGYMAPEILEKRNYRGEAADIFALGVTLFAMRQSAFPFESLS